MCGGRKHITSLPRTTVVNRPMMSWCRSGAWS